MKMKGPNPRCPECGLLLTQKTQGSSDGDIYWIVVCEHCGWEEELNV